MSTIAVFIALSGVAYAAVKLPAAGPAGPEGPPGAEGLPGTARVYGVIDPTCSEGINGVRRTGNVFCDPGEFFVMTTRRASHQVKNTANVTVTVGGAHTYSNTVGFVFLAP